MTVTGAKEVPPSNDPPRTPFMQKSDVTLSSKYSLRANKQVAAAYGS